MLREQIFGDELDIADETVLVDGRNISCLFKDVQTFGDSVGKHFKGFFENPANHLFAVDIEDLL